MSTITGKVVDGLNNQPLPGASVLISGTSKGVSAGADGSYSITDDLLSDDAQTLTFSNVGYDDYGVSVVGFNGNVFLKESDSTLAGVVVTARRVVSKIGVVPFVIAAVLLAFILYNYKKIIKWAAPVLLAFAFFSCSSVKKVNKDEKKQLAVIDNFQSNHPFKNDTTYITKLGDTVYLSSVQLDTVVQTVPVEGATQYKDRIVTKTITLTKTVVDTVIQKVTDRSLEFALQRIIDDRNVSISNIQLQLEVYKAKANRWFLIFVILLLVDTGYIVYRIKFK